MMMDVQTVKSYLMCCVSESAVVTMWSWASREGLINGNEIFDMDMFGDDGQFSDDESLLDIVRMAVRGKECEKFDTFDAYFRRNYDNFDGERLPYLESSDNPVCDNWVDVDALAECIVEKSDEFAHGNFNFDFDADPIIRKECIPHTACADALIDYLWFKHYKEFIDAVHFMLDCGMIDVESHNRLIKLCEEKEKEVE